jgi:hypothetical protein
MVQNNSPHNISEEQEGYTLQRYNSLHWSCWEMQTTSLDTNSVKLPGLESLVKVSMPWLLLIFVRLFNVINDWADYKLLNIFHIRNANLTHNDLNARIDKQENWWNVHNDSYSTLKSRATLLGNGRLSYCLWSIGMFIQSHQFKAKNGECWWIAINASVRLKLQATAIWRFNSIFDSCYQMMWLLSGASEDLENNTVLERHGAEIPYSTTMSILHAM